MSAHITSPTLTTDAIPAAAGSPASATAGVRAHEPIVWSMKAVLRQPPTVLVIFFLWVLLIYEPEWWLASFGLGPLKRIPTLLFPVVVAFALLRLRLSIINWWLVLFLVSHTVMVPFASNQGFAFWSFKAVLYLVALITATAAVVGDRADRVQVLLALFLFQFVWWTVHGVPGGRVMWHTTLGNEDGFGPMLGIGLGFALPIAFGASDKRLRRAAGVIAVMCIVGVVASIARGAVLSAGLVLVLMWLRSDRKGAVLAGAVVAGVVTVLASSWLFPGGGFWAEMATVSAGTEDQTGHDRMVLWGAAWRVFLANPVFGVGASNFGAYAAEFFNYGDVGHIYADPGVLYGRVLHNIYMQVLSEQGIFGVVVFLGLLLDFWIRVLRLMSPAAGRRWTERAGPRWELRSIALGLEGAMAGFLANGFFYDQLYTAPLYCMVALAHLLTLATAPRPQEAARTTGERTPTRSVRSSRAARRRAGSRRLDDPARVAPPVTLGTEVGMERGRGPDAGPEFPPNVVPG